MFNVVKWKAALYKIYQYYDVWSQLHLLAEIYLCCLLFSLSDLSMANCSASVGPLQVSVGKD